MNSNFTKHSFILFVLLGLSIHPLLAQSVLNPADPLITYNPKSKPVQPAYGQIGKWVRTVRMGWNSSDYKAYIYNGTAFRLKFPKTYNPAVNDGKKYPILIFFHGYGEKDSIYDNEYQLYHGADLYQTAINNGTFDGYALFMQSTGYWGIGHYQNIVDLVNYMVANNKVDPFQVMLNGLSAGGQAVWEILNSYPSYFCAAMPMSWSSSLYEQSAFVNSVKFTPLWETQGGKDINPAPYTTYQVRDAMLNAGGNYKLTEYPYAEHNTWDPGWNNMDFWPFFKRAYSSNPWTLGGKTQFFPGDTIKATLGLNTGFSAYQWRKDGIVIPSATSNTLTVTQLGVYDARVQRLGIWSEWSRVPVTLKMAAFTVVPATIQAENYNAMSGVMAETTTDAGAGQDVAYIDNGDWMDYAVSVPTAGKYAIDFRISSPYTDAQIQVRAFDRSILGTLNVPKTGDWQIWKTATDTITLPAGYQTLRLMSTGASGWNINWINIKFLGAVIPVTPPPVPVPTPVPTVGYTTIPAKMEAENWSVMNGAQTETTSDVGGGLDVSYMDPADWMDYPINVPAAGSYIVQFRVGTPANNAQLELRQADGTVLANVKIPNTGGYQSWQTVSATIVLPLGKQTLRVVSTAPVWNSWNINWISFNNPSAATTPNPPPVPAPGTNYLLIPAKIEAENWLTMSGAQTEITSDVGGGLDVSYMDPADWMDYAVNAPTAGSYTVQFRIGTPAYNAQLELRQANGTVLANVKMPYTGGYQSWQTVSVTVNLPQGQQVLRIVSTSPQWNSWNINWISFSNGTAVAGTTIMANTSLRSPISNVSGTSFNIYPVPARDALTLDINNENTGKLIVQVVGLNGIVQKEYTYYKNDPGNNQVHLNIGDLPRGEYFLKAKMANWNNSRKITKL